MNQNQNLKKRRLKNRNSTYDDNKGQRVENYSQNVDPIRGFPLIKTCQINKESKKESKKKEKERKRKDKKRKKETFVKFCSSQPIISRQVSNNSFASRFTEMPSSNLK